MEKNKGYDVKLSVRRLGGYIVLPICEALCRVKWLVLYPMQVILQ